MPEFRILGVGRKKKREGRGISDGNPDSLNCFCCLRYSASCNLHGPVPAGYLAHTWLLKVQAKGTAVLEYAREGKLSSSAKFLLSLRGDLNNFKEINEDFSVLLDSVVDSPPALSRWALGNQQTHSILK